MLVSGVRRSWEIARRRFARIRSFSASLSLCSRSAIISSCRVSFVVMALIVIVMISIQTKVTGYPLRVKLISKNGKVKNPLIKITQNREEIIPYRYPVVHLAIRMRARI
ncbi:hypothetical protein IMSAGC020_02025 [Lachnospiraceae bacterium]|nr:hypothetical protein IMSAGC020_02025 [Lachnospiraceae bacterium]